MVKKGCFHGEKTPKTQLKNAVFQEKNAVFVYRKRRFPTRAWYFRVQRGQNAKNFTPNCGLIFLLFG